MLIGDPLEPELQEKKGILFAVADGLGGMERGEVASGMAVLELHHLFKAMVEFTSPSWLREAFRKVNQRIFGENKPLAVDEWMGTTLTASLFFKDQLTVGHVGDSRLYRIREGVISRLTTDHSLDRYTLTRVVGTDSKMEADIYQTEVEPGDTYVQCSDGLYSMVSDEEISATASSCSPEEGCRRLVELANGNGGADNITLQIIRVES